MPLAGCPPWLSHLYYRVNYAAHLTGLTLAFSFRFAGRAHMPPRGPALLLANHQSFLDPSIVGVTAGRDIYYLARKTLFTSPLLAWYLRSMNGVPVDLEGVPKEGLKATIDLLQAGHAVVIFPEGRRTDTGALQPLMPGVHLVLKRVPVPVVPIGIAGAYEAFPRTRKWPVLSPFMLPAPRRGALAAVIGRPLDPGRLLKLSREEFLQTLFDAVQAVQRQAERLRRKA